MRNAPPEVLTLDRVATPVGEVLLVTDGEGAVRALDFADYEARMARLLARHAPGAVLTEGRSPEAVRRAVEAWFEGDLAALDGLTVRTTGTDFQRTVWAALRAIPAGETRTYGQLAAAIGSPLPHGLATADWLAEDLGPAPHVHLGRIELPATAGSGFLPYA